MHQVVKTEDGLAVALPDGRHLPITMAGRPAVLGNGWIVVGANRGLSSLTLLHLSHADGNEATWFLDEQCSFIGGSMNALPDDVAAPFKAMAKSSVASIITRFLTDPRFGDDPGDNDFFFIDERTRADILALGALDELPVFRLLDADCCNGDSSGTAAFSRQAVVAAMSVSVEDTYLDACRSGEVVWLSPADGLPADEVRGFVLAHVMLVWRCVDRRNDLVFFVMTIGFADDRSVLVLIPEERLARHCMLAPSSKAAETAHNMRSVVNHFMEQGRDLVGFLRKPVAGIAHFMWGEGAIHIGHHHYNELAGLEKIVTRIEPRNYPVIYDLAGAAGANFYDGLANIFPELRNKIDLSCSTFKMMSRDAYARGIQVVRFSGSHVSAFLRERLSMAISLSDTAHDAAEIRRSTTGPVVVFGLRVENRTLTDPVGFYADLAKAITQRYGEATIIIDGHNAKPGKGSEAFTSYMEGRATARPIDLERQIVADLRQALRQVRVRIIDCVGMTVRENLAWMRIAEYCVAPWGAGLAKYRWVLNLPSYVLIGNYCKNHKGDINIYNDTLNMESPTELIYSPDELVVDRPDVPVLVEMDEIYRPYYVNYDVVVPGTVQQIMERIETLHPVAQP